jgi:hypothetical protein
MFLCIFDEQKKEMHIFMTSPSPSLISDDPASRTEGGFLYAIKVNILLTDQLVVAQIFLSGH